MSYTWTADYVYEYKDTGIVLMKYKDLFKDPLWILVLPHGDAQMIHFKTLHYMKYKDNKLALLVSTNDKHSYYNITLGENNHDVITLDLYEWLREKTCPSPEPPSAT
jgi:hypothetical protein